MLAEAFFGNDLSEETGKTALEILATRTQQALNTGELAGMSNEELFSDFDS